MSGMSNLCVEIMDLLINGYEAEEIALMLEVPVEWVYEAQLIDGLSKDIADVTLDG